MIFSQKPFQFCIPPLKSPQPLMPYCTWFFPENTSFDCANIIPKVSCFLDNWFSLLHYLFSKMHTILGKLITHIIAVLNLSFAVHNCFDKRGIAYCNILIGSIIITHCYQVNYCSSKLLVTKGGAYFLRHCQPFNLKISLLVCKRRNIFSFSTKNTFRSNVPFQRTN